MNIPLFLLLYNFNINIFNKSLQIFFFEKKIKIKLALFDLIYL